MRRWSIPSPVRSDVAATEDGRTPQPQPARRSRKLPPRGLLRCRGDRGPVALRFGSGFGSLGFPVSIRARAAVGRFSTHFRKRPSGMCASQFLALLICTRLQSLCENVAADVRRRMERTRNAGKSASSRRRLRSGGSFHTACSAGCCSGSESGSRDNGFCEGVNRNGKTEKNR